MSIGEMVKVDQVIWYTVPTDLISDLGVKVLVLSKTP